MQKAINLILGVILIRLTPNPGFLLYLLYQMDDFGEILSTQF